MTSSRTCLAILLVIICMTLSLVIGIGSLISTGAQLRSQLITAFSAPTLLVTFLDPIAMALEFIAVILIFAESRKINGLHRTLASLGLGFLIAWLTLNLGAFLPASLTGLLIGSIEAVRLGLVIKSSAAILQYLIPLLLIYGIAERSERRILIPASILTVAGNFLLTFLPIWSVKIIPISLAGGAQMYRPLIEVNYLSQPYITLLITGYLGGILYLTAYILTYIKLRSLQRLS
ncbi:MAG: hypothetical protein DRN68_09375 [Thaumarchaeota archaeon]|nr:MAG: hypothetical protein DRN68_09375 [Nitrososphaerota archaeon]